ncbi:MAG: hypothetical protein ACPG7R_07510, partial [Planctomycetota bacterium]
MRFRPIFAVLGLLLLVLSGLMLIPLGVAWSLDSAEEYPAFLLSSVITFLVGGVFWVLNNKTIGLLRAREAFAVVGMSWLLASFFGALPFWYAPSGIPSLLDACFET